MLSSDKDRLLRSTVRELLEDYDGGDGNVYGGGGGYGGARGYGVSEEFFTGIWNAFIDPLRHTAAFVERFSSEIQKLAGKLSEDVMAMYLPGYKADYEQYEEEHKERMDAITQKYSKVFARTEAHLFTGDAALMGFLYAPYQYITTRMLKKAPDKALDVIDVLAGGNSSVKQATDKVRNITGKFSHIGRMRGGPTSPKPIGIDVGAKKPIEEPKIKPYPWWNPRKEPKGKDFSKRFYGKTHYESVEEKEILDEGLKDILGKIAGLFKKSNIEQAIEQSPITKQMQSDAENYVKDFVKGVVELTDKKIKALKSTEALNKATKGKFSELIQQKGKEDAKKTAQLVVAGTKKGIKKMAIEDLEEKMKQLPKAAAPLAKIYQAGIKQIKSL